jgi:hypothetical protein
MPSRGKRVLGSTPPGRVHYWLPSQDGDSWSFDVPADLAKCVGRYARIPEFAAKTHLLAFKPVRAEARD